ncbi:MAG: tetratricopeptide repeat protein [Desulfobulbus sp.]|nr:tetratricopeptide repeat protein [Desulfobulbus sp.]
MKKSLFHKRKVIKGAFDGFTAGKAHGWAYCPDRANQPLTIEILQGEQVVAVGLANQLREDLLAQGIGNGRYGFMIPIDPAQVDANIPLQARESGNATLLPGSANISRQQPNAQVTKKIPLQGFFNGIVGGEARGWAFFPGQLTRTVKIEILQGEKVIAHGMADKFRQDLKNKGLGNGCHGFAIPVDPTLVHDASQLHAREASTGTTINTPAPPQTQANNSAKLGQQANKPPTKMAIQGFFNGFVNGEATGWIFCPDQPNKVLEIEVLQGNEVITRGQANKFRQELKDKGFGNGCHGFSIPVPGTPDPKFYWVRERSTGTGLLCPNPIKKVEGVPRIPAEQVQSMFAAELTKQKIPQSVIEGAVARCKILYRALDTGSWGVARHILDGLKDEFSAMPPIACLAGELALLTRDGEGALQAYKAAAGQDITFFWGHAGMAEAQRLIGDLDAAESAYELALAQRPGTPELQARMESLLTQSVPARLHRINATQGKEAARSMLARYAIQYANSKLVIETIIDILLQEQQSPKLPGCEEIARTTAVQQLLEAVIEETETRTQKQAE